MEVVTDPADVTAIATAGDEAQWSARAGWFDYNKDGYLEWLVGNYIEWTPENNLYCGEHLPGYRAHCRSELKPGASVVAKSEGTCKGTTSSPFLAGVVVPAIYC
ncbi:hypothetical protein SBA2_750007 [Acidobacteriia bacterium SbA2]|nr:hypothetical protein SBA2_750007 [Acidobacteriia bacterium SbA2]